MVHPSLKFDRLALAEVCRRFGIRELNVFGSVTREDFRPDSDVDVLIEFEPNHKPAWDEYYRMLAELDHVFGREIDIVNGRARLKNPTKKESILSSLERLYAA